jgi:hypothetical protein
VARAAAAGRRLPADRRRLGDSRDRAALAPASLLDKQALLNVLPAPISEHLASSARCSRRPTANRRCCSSTRSSSRGWRRAWIRSAASSSSTSTSRCSTRSRRAFGVEKVTTIGDAYMGGRRGAAAPRRARGRRDARGPPGGPGGRRPARGRSSTSGSGAFASACTRGRASRGCSGRAARVRPVGRHGQRGGPRAAGRSTRRGQRVGRDVPAGRAASSTSASTARRWSATRVRSRSIWYAGSARSCAPSCDGPGLGERGVSPAL